MTHQNSKTIRLINSAVLAGAMLVSAPFFVMLDHTLHGKSKSVNVVVAPSYAIPGQTTVIYKS